MTFFASLKIIISSLPAILNLLNELAGWLKTTFGDNPAQAIEDHAEVIRQLKSAKTPSEKADAARKLSILLRKL